MELQGNVGVIQEVHIDGILATIVSQNDTLVIITAGASSTPGLFGITIFIDENAVISANR